VTTEGVGEHKKIVTTEGVGEQVAEENILTEKG
jgi:hypothetical protein